MKKGGKKGGLLIKSSVGDFVDEELEVAFY